jgi:hypothetical protein
MGSPFSLLLHPLHPSLRIAGFRECDVLECKGCRSIINPTLVNKISLLEHQCKFCGLVDDSERWSGPAVGSNVMDIVGESAQSKPMQRKVMFALEANRVLFEK